MKKVKKGIKLSDIEPSEIIYYKASNGRLMFITLFRDFVNDNPQIKKYIIRKNKVIPIVQCKEYDNNKPYIIKKDGIIVGYIKLGNTLYWGFISIVECDYHHESLSELIKVLKKQGYKVYEQ